MVPALGPCRCCGPPRQASGRAARGGLRRSGWAGLAEAERRAGGKDLVQFPRRFVLKCARQGFSPWPPSPPRSPRGLDSPKSGHPPGQDDSCDFSVGFIARGCVGEG